MHRLTLPEPQARIEPACTDPATARSWLAGLAAAPGRQCLDAIRGQIEAIDGAPLAATTALDLLDLLRTAAVPLVAGHEARFFRKPLPLSDEERHIFEAVVRLWTSLGIAYLRRLPELPAAERLRPLNRAACAFRLAQYSHFEAARQCPAELDRLLFATLAQAASHELLAPGLADPDFPHLGEANTAGHLVWALLLRLSDPYRLNASELIVANRAFSRWRELASFRNDRDVDPKARQIDLQPLFGEALPDGVPRWLNVRSVDRKLRQRIESLKNGEGPEALKLGRELSAGACLRLLKELDHCLRSPPAPLEGESGPVDLFFGGDNAFALHRGELLNPTGRAEKSSSALAHERMAIFGFDQIDELHTAVKKIKLPCETWRQQNGVAHRPPDLREPRLASPCLVATRVGETSRLGVLFGLQTQADDSLFGGLHWYGEKVEAGWLKRQGPGSLNTPRSAAFLLSDGETLSLILPVSASVRLHGGIELEGVSPAHLVPLEVLERGVDYVRYACKRG